MLKTTHLQNEMSWDSSSDVWLQLQYPHIVASSSGLMPCSLAFSHDNLQISFSPSFSPLSVTTICCQSVRVCGQICSQFSRNGLICSNAFKYAFFYFFFRKSLIAYIFSRDHCQAWSLPRGAHAIECFLLDLCYVGFDEGSLISSCQSLKMRNRGGPKKGV